MADASLNSPFSSPLTSAQWHRVANARPRLPEHIQVTRQWVRGQRWHVLQDTRSGQSCRLNELAYGVAARLDGQLSLQALWALLDTRAHAGSQAGDAEPPSQDDVLGVIQHLHQHRLLSFDEAPDFGALVTPVAANASPALDDAAPSEATPDTRGKPRNNLMSWRLGLLNPEPWLTRCDGLAHALFSRGGLLVWSAMMLSLLLGLMLHAGTLQAHALKWMQTPRYLLIATLCYPVMKTLHEAAHALAVQRFGGTVREAGITLMMLMPVPYVDASAAHGFSHAWQRALVSAAGIMTELTLAAIGLWCWKLSAGGLLQDVGFVLWFVGCVSTVLFNANPLQRLDGYHMLTDALHLPNLAMRSKQWWQSTVLNWLRGHAPTASITSAPVAPGERPWLVAYAPLSWVYQALLWAGMTWWLGSIFSLLGWAMGLLTVWMSLVAPGLRWLRLMWQAVLWSGEHQAGVRWRAVSLLIVPAIVCLPWPDRTVVQGVVWAPEEALVRPQTDGVVQTVHVKDGEQVSKGTLLVSLHNPKLQAQHERIAAELSQAEQGAFAFMGSDLGKAGLAGDQVRRWQAELARVDEQIASLQVRAHRHGRLVLPKSDDLPGRYLHRGELLGHVLDDAPATVRVAVADQDIATLRAHTQAVSVAGHGADAPALPAHLMRDSVGATRELPSAALSSDMGGQIPTEPQDEHHMKALRPVVLVDVQVDAMPGNHALDSSRLGQRVWVRFDQGWTPLPAQAWRWLQRRALADFNPNH
jgi:putative peptide zinc metalloprotease protein